MRLTQVNAACGRTRMLARMTGSRIGKAAAASARIVAYTGLIAAALALVSGEATAIECPPGWVPRGNACGKAYGVAPSPQTSQPRAPAKPEIGPCSAGLTAAVLRTLGPGPGRRGMATENGRTCYIQAPGAPVAPPPPQPSKPAIAAPGPCSAALVARYMDEVSRQPTSRRPAPGSVVALTDDGKACIFKMPQPVVLLSPDGKRITIDLSQWKGGTLSVQQMALAKQFQLAPPPGSDAARAGGGAYTLSVYSYPHMGGKDLPVFVGMPSLNDIGRDSTEAAVAWAQANPGKASLLALSVAVNIAMPYTAAAQAALAINFMTSGTSDAVSGLVSDASKGKDFWTMSKNAGVNFVSGGLWSLPGSIVGSRVAGASAKGLFDVAAAGAVNTTTDAAVNALRGKISDAGNAPPKSAAIPDLVTPARPAAEGGIVIPILSQPVTSILQK